VEASLGLADAERHLWEGAVLAREIGRPYLEVRCLAQLGFASKIRSFATIQRRCGDAIALADLHGWGAEWIIAPALIAPAGTMAWTRDFDEARAVAAAHRAGPASRHRARHQAARAHGERHAAGRPRPPPRGAAGVERGRTAHAALLADILDVIRGASPVSVDLPVPPQAGQLSPGELRVLRYLPTNLSRPEIAADYRCR
jgi:hypothetical protein